MDISEAILALIELQSVQSLNLVLCPKRNPPLFFVLLLFEINEFELKLCTVYKDPPPPT